MSSEDQPVSPGALLVRRRWDKATPAYRRAVGQMLKEARARKRLGKVRAKRAKKAARK